MRKRDAAKQLRLDTAPPPRKKNLRRQSPTVFLWSNGQTLTQIMREREVDAYSVYANIARTGVFPRVKMGTTKIFTILPETFIDALPPRIGAIRYWLLCRLDIEVLFDFFTGGKAHLLHPDIDRFLEMASVDFPATAPALEKAITAHRMFSAAKTETPVPVPVKRRTKTYPQILDGFKNQKPLRKFAESAGFSMADIITRLAKNGDIDNAPTNKNDRIRHYGPFLFLRAARLMAREAVGIRGWSSYYGKDYLDVIDILNRAFYGEEFNPRSREGIIIRKFEDDFPGAFPLLMQQKAKVKQPPPERKQELPQYPYMIKRAGEYLFIDEKEVFRGNTRQAAALAYQRRVNADR